MSGIEKATAKAVALLIGQVFQSKINALIDEITAAQIVLCGSTVDLRQLIGRYSNGDRLLFILLRDEILHKITSCNIVCFDVF